MLGEISIDSGLQVAEPMRAIRKDEVALHFNGPANELGRFNFHNDLAKVACPDQPEVLHDLPAGGRRLVQRVDGYRATLVAGTPVFENGSDTGARPGRLVRAAQ